MNSQTRSDSCAYIHVFALFKTLLAGIAGVLMAVGSAYGQGQPAPAQATSAQAAPAQATNAPAPAAQTTTVLKAVAVTGSLIRSANQVSASPIVQVNLTSIKQNTSATSLVQALNQLPQLSATSGAFQSGALQTINLRGLGSNRNLVLLDGRRLPLADINGDVDITLIPEAAVGSAQIITGGASAVYGSDAMSGVVNFITIPYFNGIKGKLQYGNSTKNDFGQQEASIALGSAFDQGKGNVLLSFGYTDTQALYGSQRSFFNDKIPSSYLGTGTFVPDALNLPSQSAVNALFAGYGVSARILNTQNLGFNTDGTLFRQNGAANYKGPNGTDDFAVLSGNVRMPVGPQYIIGNPIKRKQAFSKFNYNVSPNFSVYGQFMYVSSEADTNSGLSLTQFAVPTVPVTNPFVPADLQTLLASRPNPTAPFTLNARYVGIGNRIEDSTYTTTQYIAGATGNLLLGDWTYDVYASYSETSDLDDMYNAVLASQVQNLYNAPGGGSSICAGGFNPFGLNNSTNISQACVNYMTTTAHSYTQLSQNIVQGTMQGSLFQLPAGNVQMAVLADSRADSYGFTPDSQIAAGNVEAVLPSPPAQGRTEVNELATQFSIPLLSNLPFAKMLTTDLAYRYSKYKVSGGVDTYEADLKWRPVDSLLVRAGYQRAIRAPNIGELFETPTGAQVGIGTPPGAIGDPCDIRSPARTGPGGASVRQLCLEQGIPSSIIDSYLFPTTATPGDVSGNTSLTPETANTYNAGLQWTSTSQSQLFSNMSLSLDYYNIDIKNVISSLPGTTSLAKCFNLDGSNPSYSPSNPFCQLIHRDAQGQISLIQQPYLNLGRLQTDGVDLQFNWQPSLMSMGINASGAMFLSTNVSYTRSYKIQTLPGTATQDFVGTLDGGTPLPRWKGLTSLGYQNQNFEVGLAWNYLGAMQESTVVTSPNAPSQGMPTYNTFDIFGAIFLNDQLTLRMGINDVTNKQLIPVLNTAIGTDTNVYNPIGTTYFVSLNFTM